MLKQIFKKVPKHTILKINYYVIKTIFLKCSSNVLLDLFWSLKKCKFITIFLVVIFCVKDDFTYATDSN